jgi:hypothetical protein
MVHGLIDYLTGPSLDAKILRDNFVFKIVPMLNPDGVVVGNYRCSLAGCDLNRCWLNPDRRLHPTIFHTKQVRWVFRMHGRTRHSALVVCASRAGCTCIGVAAPVAAVSPPPNTPLPPLARAPRLRSR